MLEWLGLDRKVARDGKSVETCLRDRKTLEMFGYVMRTILQRIVLEAVKHHHSGELKPLESGSLSLEDYRHAISLVTDWTVEQIDRFKAELKTFGAYAEELSQQGMELASAKLSWDRMSSEARHDFRMRVEAVAHLKSELRRAHGAENDR